MRSDKTLCTVEELDELPVGSVVLCLWDTVPHHVCQKYAGNVWMSWPSMEPIYPLGSARQGEMVALLWKELLGA